MPPREFRTRTIAAYSIHGRTREGIIDYSDFFERVLDTPPSLRRQEDIVGQVVSVTAAERLSGGLLAIRLVSGDEFNVPTLLDESGREELLDRRAGTYVNGTWMVVNPENRLVAIESKRPGVGVVLIERYFEVLGRHLGYSSLRIDLNPASTDEFDAEVRNLATVKKVAVSVNQPNLDWTDDHNAIHDYAAQSGARTAKVEMTAGRGDSLSVDRGIVQDVLGLSRKMISSLKNVIVTGTAPGDAGEKTINLNRFQKKSSVSVRRGADPQEELLSLEDAARALVNEDEADTEP